MRAIKNKEFGITSRSYVWNAIFAGLGAIQSPFILFAVSRKKDLSTAGIITMGFALSFLITTIGGYGIRNYQASDTKEEYSFSDYFHVRIITVSFAMLLTIAYLAFMLAIGRYTVYKATIIIEIVLYNMVGTFEGLYIGRLQQMGRFDVGSIIGSLRLGMSTLIILGAFFFCDDVIVILGAGIILSIILDALLLPIGKKYTDYLVVSEDREKTRRILLMAWPLCIGAALHNYVGNAPKYLVDIYLSDGVQAISGYIMMPMFIITVLNGFILTPTIKTLGDIWVERDMKRLKKRILVHTLIILILSIFVLFFGLHIGLPFFSWFYNIDLTSYKTEFMLLMGGGILFTLSGYYAVLLTIIRKQLTIVVGCISAIIAYMLLGGRFLKQNDLVGAGQIYIIANFVMVLVFVIGLKKTINEKRYV